MTLDEAIKWYEDKESEYEYLSKEHEDFAMMAEQYQQFVEWFMELKDLKAEQNDQYIFIRELMKELKEAKQLLKLAMEDINSNNFCCKFDSCKVCSKKYNVSCDKKFQWHCTDKALKLLGDESNV